MHNLKDDIEVLNAYFGSAEEKNTKISEAKVGWHLEHAMLAAQLMIRSFLKSNPNEYSPKFQLKRWILFKMGKIPRGRTKAPKPSIPNETNKTLEEFQAILQNTLESIKELENTNENGKFFNHFVFGHLDKKQLNRLIHIHTNHHIKIIEDILHKTAQ